MKNKKNKGNNNKKKRTNEQKNGIHEMRVMIINLKKKEQVRIKVRNMYMDNIEEKRKKIRTCTK